MACLAEPELERIAASGLAAVAGTTEHLASCARCAAAVGARVRAARRPDDAGGQLGRYQLLDERGRGAFGSVFEAYDPALERRVAIKRIPFSARSSPAALAELLREAKAMAQIHHPNVLPIFDAGRTDDGVFLTMPIVDGETLQAWAARYRSRRAGVDAERVMGDFAGKLAAGLSAIHAAGFVHRDIKPSNLLVAGANAWVADLGLARRAPTPTAPVAAGDGELTASTLTESFAGTPAYMAPECLDGAAASPASDQYALAVTLAEIVTGRRPFAATTVAELAAAARSKAPRLDGVPRRYRAALAQALAPAPERRFGSMEAFAAALAAAAPRRGGGRRLAAVAAVVVAAAAVAWAVRPADISSVPPVAAAVEPAKPGASAASSPPTDPAKPGASAAVTPPTPRAGAAADPGKPGASAASSPPTGPAKPGASAPPTEPGAPPPAQPARAVVPPPRPTASAVAAARCPERCAQDHQQALARCAGDEASCGAAAATAFDGCAASLGAEACAPWRSRFVKACLGREVAADASCSEHARTCEAACRATGERCAANRSEAPQSPEACRARWLACRDAAAGRQALLGQARKRSWAACATANEACRAGAAPGDCGQRLLRCNTAVAADYDRGMEQVRSEDDGCLRAQEVCYARASGGAAPVDDCRDAETSCLARCAGVRYQCLATPVAAHACATAAEATLEACRRACGR